jgi:pimeloyl-ACP methyl ester carboxylesterase
MTRHLLALTLAATVLLTRAASMGGQTTPLSETWIGGYHSGQTFVPITVTGKAEAPRAYLLLQNSREVVLSGWTLEGNRLAFSMPSASGTLAFSGTMTSGVARGIVRRGETEFPFHLLNLHKVADDVLDRYAGSYAFDNRRHLVIRHLGVVLKFDDSETGRFGMLVPTGDATFVGGPGQLMFDPADVTATFAADGKVVLKYADGSTSTGRKVNGYRQEMIVFRNAGLTLSGTLFLPAGPGPHPAVVGVHGSGAADRNAFGEIPAQLALEGTAFFAYDKRGTGKSTGNWRNATFEMLAGDVVAAIAELKTRNDIDRRRIGMWGASQAGFIQPMIAANHADLAVAVLVGPSGLTAALQETYDDQIALRRAGFSEADVKRATDLQNTINEYYRSGREKEKVDQAIAAVRGERWFAATDLGSGLAAAEYLPPPDVLADTWWRKIMDYDPTEHWRLVRTPTLVLLGECDDSAPAAEGARRIGSALEQAANKDHTIKLLPMANHGLWKTRECFVTDYPQVPGYEPQYLPVMFDWLRAHGFGSR